MAFDVTESDFEARVIERSREVPVVVDFWAEWCGPCRVLGPALESAVADRDGEVELAKVDTDRNPNLATSFQIGSIPAVKAFKDGQVVSEFLGAIRPAQIEQFLDGLVPSAADKLAAGDDEESLRKALQIDPRNAKAAGKLGRLLLARGEAAEALQVLEGLAGDFEAQGLAARARLSLDGRDRRSQRSREPGPKLLGLGRGRPRDEPSKGSRRRSPTRRIPRAETCFVSVMVAIFTELGADHPTAREHRRRLAAALT